jgi:hypothetical protein
MPRDTSQQQQQHWWSCGRKSGASSMSQGRQRQRQRRLCIRVDGILIVAIAIVVINTFGIYNLQQLDQYSVSVQPFITQSFLFPLEPYRQATSSNVSYLPDIGTISGMNDQGGSLWQHNPLLPLWLQDYFSWHQHILANKLTNVTKHDYNYIVLRCYRFDERCGGVSDRLKPIPLILLAAAQSQRMFFIHWYQRPYPLEEFLLPPPLGGLNWSVPNFLVQDFLQHKKGAITRAGMVLSATRKDGWVKPVHLHDAQGGSTQYDEVNGPDSFLNVYHHVFRILFRPSIGLETIIQQKMQAGGINDNVQLTPGQYSVVHYRAQYGREVDRHPKLRQPSFIQTIAFNAIKCAIQLQPGDPIYFASDNMIALDAVRRIAAYTNYPILTFDRDENVVLRLDDTGIGYSNNITTTTTTKQRWVNSYQPSDYYSTFVDLYLAGNGHCVTFGRGGFGRFVNLLSYNASCSFKHVRQFFAVPCQGYPPLDKTEDELVQAGLSLFLES